MVGIKECLCCDEHQVMYGIAESLYFKPETNNTLYVNYTGINFFQKKKAIEDRLETSLHFVSLVSKRSSIARHFGSLSLDFVFHALHTAATEPRKRLVPKCLPMFQTTKKRLSET